MNLYIVQFFLIKESLLQHYTNTFYCPQTWKFPFSITERLKNTYCIWYKQFFLLQWLDSICLTRMLCVLFRLNTVEPPKMHGVQGSVHARTHRQAHK